MDYKIESKEQLRALWTDIYSAEGKPDWSKILPYYDDDIVFKDTVQEIRGIQNFKAMTERLVGRAGSLEMTVTNTAQNDSVYFIEWIMTLSFKKYPKSSVYGLSRVSLNEAGKIADQRDYYDLWGDIFDNIPGFGRAYRKFMAKKFG